MDDYRLSREQRRRFYAETLLLYGQRLYNERVAYHQNRCAIERGKGNEDKYQEHLDYVRIWRTIQKRAFNWERLDPEHLFEAMDAIEKDGSIEKPWDEGGELKHEHS